jgi:hypothetical protein
MDDGRDLSQAPFPDGIALAMIAGEDPSGRPLVYVDSLPGPVVAETVIDLTPADTGGFVVVAFGPQDPTVPIVLGRLRTPAPQAIAPRSTERIALTAANEITLTCGKASITLTRSGKIVLRGTYILSRSSGPNRIKGGSIELN